MHTCSLQHRTSLLIPVLSFAGLLALCCSSTSIAAVASSSRSLAPQHVSSQGLKAKRSSLAGKWSGKYSGAFSGTFTLRWTLLGSRLRGSITLKPGRYVQHHRHRARQQDRIWGRRCRRHLYRFRVGQVDVGQLQDRERRRPLERSQDLLTARASVHDCSTAIDLDLLLLVKRHGNPKVSCRRLRPAFIQW